MHIGEICTRSVVTCGRDASAIDVARLMRDRHVGDVIVVEPCEGGSKPIGIVTDRDLVVQVMAASVDPHRLRAEDLVSRQLVTALESEGVYDAIWHMRSKGIRRLPVVDSRGRLRGVLTADDLTRCLADELAEIGRIGTHQVEVESTVRESPAH
jgi:CBS domain-containing protein